MKKLLFGALLLALVAVGCATTDYPVITDDRGDYSGVIRTGHKAYQIPSGQTATLWNDGSDELFSMIYQNQYGDQKIYTFNNFDPTGAVNFLDQTYCDWRYEGPEVVRAWNPVNSVMDDIFDYEFFTDASGARSLSLLVSYSSRLGECGDRLFFGRGQEMAAEFANLATTTWRGQTAYIVPVNAENTAVTLTTASTSVSMPIYGQYNGFLNDKMQLAVPMTPNARHQLRWLAGFVAENGSRASASLNYGSLSTSIDLAFAADGINYNMNRF